MTATARRHARRCRERYGDHYGRELDVVVVGQIARDLVLLVDAVPSAGGSVDVDIACAARRPRTRTALIVTVVAEGEGWRHFEDVAATTLTDADITAAADTLTAAKSVIVQLQQPAALTVARLAHAAGKRVVLDGAPPADQRAALLATATVLRADAHEAELLTGTRMGSVEVALRAARELLAEGPSVVALAVEGQGDVVVWADDEVFLPYADTPTVDTTGAGDSFIAALTVALNRDEPLAAAARAAADAAGSTVSRLGGRPALGAGPGPRVP